jgi:hypothetical protein
VLYLHFPIFSLVSVSLSEHKDLNFSMLQQNWIILNSFVLTVYSSVLVGKAPDAQLHKNFQHVNGTRTFITALARELYSSLSRARWILSILPRSILKLFSKLRLGLPIGLFLSGFPERSFYYILGLFHAPWRYSNYTSGRGLRAMKVPSCFFSIFLELCT